MNKEERVNRVLEIRQDPERPVLQISTDRSGELWVDTEKFEKDDVEILVSSLDEKEPIVIEFDSQTKQIVWVNYADIDSILALSDPRENSEEVRVHALKIPSLLALRKDHPRFEELYALLAKALAGRDTGVEAAMAIVGTNIVDVVLIEPPPNN